MIPAAIVGTIPDIKDRAVERAEIGGQKANHLGLVDFGKKRFLVVGRGQIADLGHYVPSIHAVRRHREVYQSRQH